MIKAKDLENRAEGKASAISTEIDLAEQFAELGRRIEAARRVAPTGRDLHCRDCFERGRDAALRVIDGIG